MKMRRQVRKRAGWHDLNNSAVVLYTVRSLLFRSFSFQWSHPERPAESIEIFTQQRRAATSCAAEFMGEVGGWLVWFFYLSAHAATAAALVPYCLGTGRFYFTFLNGSASDTLNK
jgi:hypothetical protein